MNNNNKKANLLALFITFISIIVLISGVIFSLKSRVSDDEISDIEEAAKTLVTANFDNASYFGISSLPPAAGYKLEDYPEGMAPCSGDIFKSYGELSAFVKETYTSEAAALILNSEVNGVKRYFDYDGELCMAVVQPDTTYTRDWSNFKIKLSAIKKQSAKITVTVIDKKSSKTDTIELLMVKNKDKWLLNNFDY